MSCIGLAPPPPFLPVPGRPPVPWPQWHQMFENFLLASGASDFKPERRKALLIHSLGVEGQRVFSTIVRTNVQLMDSDSEDEEFDDVVTVLALRLTRIQRNRIPRYFEEVLADVAPVFIHDRRQCRQDAAD
ncbi:hypothetical protein HPB50_010751 [Hyalomma asiaticum]|uniref:Uncharacterized protein n=1 Tax=Hyalomma asiaticum TaxID=266040 RepID=A0ACB7TFI8_HYAAI|nr:hypothetical protein HPB50_010751 [Hyalomma asiaticum]